VLYAPGMRASLIHGDGKIVVEVPDRKDLAGMDLAKPGSRYTLHVKSGQTANIFATGRAYSTGDERMSAWRTIRPVSLLMDKPLMISVNRDMKGIFAPWRRGALIQGGLFGVLVLASLFGLYFYQRRQQKYDRLAASYMAELQKSEENYRSLFQNASIGIFHSLPEGKFLRVNPALAKMLEYGSPEEMISAITNIRAQIYVDSKKQSNLLAATLEQTGWVYAENRYRRKDGTILTANLAVRKVLNADNTVAYLEGFVEDITDRRLAEEVLEEERKRLQQALDEVKTLRGIFPICANCKKIRDDKGYWNQVEMYVSDHTEAKFSHGICPDCAKKLYPELYEKGNQYQ
jgi:PAS domain S-box-containing protein